MAVGAVAVLAACGSPDPSVPADRADPAGDTTGCLDPPAAAAPVNGYAVGYVSPADPAFRTNGPPSAVPANQNLSRDVAYTGSAECSVCHFDIHDTFKHTGMGSAFYPFDVDDAIEDFTTHNEMILPSGVHYRMVLRGRRAYQQQYVLDAGGSPIAFDERRIDYVIGSGNHSRSYVTIEDDKLYQMPVCWYPDTSQWDLCPGYEGQNDHFTRKITQPCVFCHNGRMEPVPGPAPNVFRRPYATGIGCERCHGPGALHVAKHWAAPPGEPMGTLDETIVNPARLPPDRRMQICLQCHMGDSKATAMVNRDGVSTQDWRPGQRIDEAILLFRDTEPSPTDFGLSAQADRLFLSRCFQQSGGQLECLTCHNPHETVYDGQRPADFFTARCRECHDDADCGASRADRDATQPPDNCVVCHMRSTEPDDHPHTTFTDHWIRARIDVPPREPSRHTMVPMLPEGFARLPVAEQFYYLGKAYLRRSLTTSGPERTDLRSRAEEVLHRAVDCGLDTAPTWFELGVNLKYEQRWASAITAFESSLARDRAHRDAAFALGQSLMAVGRPAEAAATFSAILERVPEDGAAMAELGLVQLGFRRPAEALRLYDTALRADPMKPSLHANRSMSLQAGGRTEDALEAMERALRLNPESSEYWRFYASLLQAAGRPGEAGEAARQALQARPPAEPVAGGPMR
ncbi:MAG: tetratricopeptide repeat protein [Acidobacteriota bacterium]